MDKANSLTDRLLSTADTMVRTLFSTPIAARSSPGDAQSDVDLSKSDTTESIRLMRVNHTGEVCAQALYQGQALTARNSELRETLNHAASEESDHLAWCHQRIKTLGGNASVLNPLFYSGSLAIGALAGAAGDRTSAAFLAETERQVVAHLDKHIEKLPEDDLKSRSVLIQMREDELRHATTAENQNPIPLPMPARLLMRAMSKVMTSASYRI